MIDVKHRVKVLVIYACKIKKIFRIERKKSTPKVHQFVMCDVSGSQTGI